MIVYTNYLNLLKKRFPINLRRYIVIKIFLMKYVVIIPAKNEEDNIESTVLSVINQTIPPVCVLVVDNDSNDKTADVVKKMQNSHSKLHYMNYNGDNSYSLGGKIVKIFKAGKKYIDEQKIHYDYLVKMDADVSFDRNLFLNIHNSIKGKKIGIVSPLAYSMRNNRKLFISTPDWHTSGDFKIYSRDCYEEMGGLSEDLGWDCADNISAIEKGYITEVIKDLSYEQKRPIGRYSLLKGWKRQGVGAYKLRYSYMYFALRSVHNLFRKPYILGSLFSIYQFVISHFNNTERVIDREKGKILRKLLWSSLVKGSRKKRFYLFQLFAMNKN